MDTDKMDPSYIDWRKKGYPYAENSRSPRTLSSRNEQNNLVIIDEKWFYVDHYAPETKLEAW